MRSAAYAAGGDAITLAAAGADPTTSFGDMAAAVSQFFLNGGTQAYVIGLLNSSLTIAPSTVTFGGVTLTATEITDAAFSMKAVLRPVTPSTSPTLADLADLIITYAPASGGAGTVTETFRQLSMQEKEADGTTPNPNYVLTRLASSQLVTAAISSATTPFPGAQTPAPFPAAIAAGATVFDAANFTAAMAQDSGLDKVPVFNLMVLPGVYNTLVLPPRWRSARPSAPSC